MAALFPLFTVLHGPTSYYEGGEWLGQGGLFWGAMMSAAPSLLIACGLWGARRQFAGGSSRAVRIGFALVLIALVVPAVVDLSIRAIGTPLMMPVMAAGLLLVGLGRHHGTSCPTTALRALAVIGAFLGSAFIVALVPTDISDDLNGYRVFGVLAYFLVGIGWVVVGAILLGGPSRARRSRRRTVAA